MNVRLARASAHTVTCPTVSDSVAADRPVAWTPSSRSDSRTTTSWCSASAHAAEIPAMPPPTTATRLVATAASVLRGVRSPRCSFGADGEGVGRPAARSDRGRTARAGGPTGSGPRSGRGAHPDCGVRRVPDGPAHRRGRSSAARHRRRARPRDRRCRRRARRWARRFSIGDRVGIAWLRRTCGTCRFCRRGDENLCETPAFTGWDADGGYAEYAVVDEQYAYGLPAGYRRRAAAPLLCAGIIGFRALRRAAVPPAGRLGIYGFGASAHLAAQVGHRRRRDRARDDALAGGAPIWRGRSVRRRRATRSTVHPNRSTQPSCSPRPARSCRSRSRPSTEAARWPSPASTSPTFRRCATTTTCSRSDRCAASPPTPVAMARTSSRWLPVCGCRSPRLRTTSPERPRHCVIWPPTVWSVLP